MVKLNINTYAMNSFYSLLVNSDFPLFSAAIKCADFDVRQAPDGGIALARKIFDLPMLEKCEIAKHLKRIVASSNYEPMISDVACICLFASQEFCEIISIAERSIENHKCVRQDMARIYICALICQARWEDLDSFASAHQVVIDHFALNQWIALAQKIRRGDIATICNSLTNGIPLHFVLSAYNTSILVTSLEHSKGELLETNELRILSEYINGGNVLDVGSLCGNHSIYFSKVCGAKKVVSIDSESGCCALTELNFRLNDINPEKYSIFNASAGGDIPFSEIGNAACTEPGIYLDNRCEKYDLVKVDIDGGELDFLKRSREYFSLYKTPLMCEVATKSAARVFDIMNSIGYDCAPLTNRAISDGDNNYLFKHA